ncbi:MAG: DUF2339 domain-containing protein, partial [Acidobacteria bacterium]|nr:DUF2339 domain-containing protein [Acidobacteriota bacterium]
MTTRPDSASADLEQRVSELTRELASVLEEVRLLRAEVSSLRTHQETASAGLPEASEGQALDPSMLEDGGEGETLVEVLEESEDSLPSSEEGEIETAAAFEGEAEAPEGEPQVPEPLARERARRAMDLETRIGGVWLNRIGLVSLIIGIAFLAREVEPRLQPWHRVLLGYLGSAVLFGIGRRFEEKLQAFARPLMAGGLAAGFFTSFAGYFLPRMECLPLFVSLALMALFVGGIFYCAERWNSQSIAGLALLLGHIAAYVASVDTETLPMV